MQSAVFLLILKSIQTFLQQKQQNHTANKLHEMF